MARNIHIYYLISYYIMKLSYGGHKVKDIKYNVSCALNNTFEEAYKVLRANIQFCDPDKRIKTLVFTSYSLGEGKSTTSINLSVVLSKYGLKVLYLDADLRKPMMFKSIKSDDYKGLSNILIGQSKVEETIKKTNIEGFDFISCGIKTQNPGELISNGKFEEMLDQIRDSYDMIIIDTPPMGSVIDAAVIASMCDAVILVISQNKVKCRNAAMMKEQLEKANANILGAVFNKVNKIDYKNYYNGYDYYGSSKKYAKKI